MRTELFFVCSYISEFMAIALSSICRVLYYQLKSRKPAVSNSNRYEYFRIDHLQYLYLHYVNASNTSSIYTQLFTHIGTIDKIIKNMMDLMICTRWQFDGDSNIQRALFCLLQCGAIQISQYLLTCKQSEQMMWNVHGNFWQMRRCNYF